VDAPYPGNRRVRASSLRLADVPRCWRRAGAVAQVISAKPSAKS